MVAYYKLLDELRDFLIADPYVNGVTFGDLEDVDLDKTSLYPLAHFGVTNATINQGNVEFTLSLLVMDICSEYPEDRVERNGVMLIDNTQHVLNETLGTITRAVKSLEKGELSREGIKIEGTGVEAEAFKDRFNDRVAGWIITIGVKIINTASYCDPTLFATAYEFDFDNTEITITFNRDIVASGETKNVNLINPVGGGTLASLTNTGGVISGNTITLDMGFLPTFVFQNLAVTTHYITLEEGFVSDAFTGADSEAVTTQSNALSYLYTSATITSVTIPTEDINEITIEFSKTVQTYNNVTISFINVDTLDNALNLDSSYWSVSGGNLVADLTNLDGDSKDGIRIGNYYAVITLAGVTFTDGQINEAISADTVTNRITRGYTPTVGVNLIDNAYFDDDFDGWLTVGGATITHNGDGSVTVGAGASSGGLYQDISGLDSNKLYRIDARVRQINTDSIDPIIWIVPRASFGSPNEQTPINNTSYETKQFYVYPLVSVARVYLQWISSTGSEVQVDSVTLREVINPTEGALLTTGGDYESGLEGSSFDGSGSVSTYTLNTTNPIDGLQDGLLDITTFANARPAINVTDIVGTYTKGQPYRLSFDYKVNSGTFIIADLLLLDEFDTSVDESLTGEGTFTYDVIPTTDTNSNKLLIYAGPSLCNVQIDNIRINEINEE